MEKEKRQPKKGDGKKEKRTATAKKGTIDKTMAKKIMSTTKGKDRKRKLQDIVESSDRAERRAIKRKREQAESNEPKKAPRTIESMRVHDITEVRPDDQETFDDVATDEFAEYFNGKTPKIMITTNMRPTKEVYRFVKAFSKILRNCVLVKRERYTLKQIATVAEQNDFTDIIIVNENRKKVTDMLIAHLPKGPIAHFKIFRIMYPEDIKCSSRAVNHASELILNNFTSRLGLTIGRMLIALFPHNPDFLYRQVATFHCQRDFIFFRHHRYMFEDSETKFEKSKGPITTNLVELGPRFVLKLLSLQLGTLKERNREYIFKRSERRPDGKYKFDL